MNIILNSDPVKQKMQRFVVTVMLHTDRLSWRCLGWSCSPHHVMFSSLAGREATGSQSRITGGKGCVRNPAVVFFFSARRLSSLHLQLEAHAHLVPTGIEVLGIDQSGQSEFHTYRQKYPDYYVVWYSESNQLWETWVTWSQALCVTNSDQTGIVYFGLQRDARNLKTHSDFFHESETECDGVFTEMEQSLSSWYLAAMPKRVLLLPAVHARFTAVSNWLLTFW